MSGESIKESDASDNSFVIIGPGSFNCTPSFVNEIEQESIKVSTESDSVTETQNATQDNLAISTSSTGSNIFDCDLQEKLNQQLLKENYQLKETLSQNNLAIKTQLNTFFMWQQEVLKTQESHKQKFLETKDLIWKLREENAQLKSQLEDIGHESLSLDSTDKIEDSEILIVGKPKPNDKSLKQLKQDLINFEVENQNLLKRNDYLVEQCNELQIKLRDSRKEIFELNKQLEDSERENTSLKQKITNVKSSNESAPSLTLSNHEARSQIRNLFKQLEDERAKVLILKQELKKVQSNGKDNEVNKNPTEELTEYLDQLSDINTSFKNQNQRFSGLNSWINLAEENLDCGAQTLQSFDGAIMSELTQLKDYLKVEENAFKRKE